MAVSHEAVEILDPRAEALIERGAELVKIIDGLIFTEGPVWDFDAHHLTFSDIPGDTMYRWSEEDGLRVLRKPSNFSNGLTYDRRGNLVACEHRTRRVTREVDGRVEVVADSYAGKRLNAPNDVVVASDGSILFTDPHYGLGEGFGGPAEQEQPFRAVYRIPAEGGEPQPLVSDFDGPNGLALSADESQLFVDDTERSHIRVFRVGRNWVISGGEVFVELPSEGDFVLDGMKLDSEGNIWCTGAGGIWIVTPAADVIGHIRFPEIAANLAWGDDDARTLYVTASTGVYRIRCRVPGLVPYRR
jgi:gluconolactonase